VKKVFCAFISNIVCYINDKLAFYTERTILLKYLKLEVDTDLKIILLNYQNM